jgi:RNA polymerase sigma factor (sigma-70 family)
MNGTTTATVARNEGELIEQYEGLVRICANRLWKNVGRFGVSEDDVRQEARIKLLQLIRKYDPARGASLNTWVKGRLYGRLICWWRTVAGKGEWGTNAARFAVVFPKSIFGPRECGWRVRYDAPHAEPPASHLTLDEVRRAGELTSNEAHVLYEAEIGERRLKDIGRDLGLTESRASQLRKQAIQKLREAGREKVLAAVG